MRAANFCPQCGVPMPKDSVDGRCPQCNTVTSARAQLAKRRVTMWLLVLVFFLVATRPLILGIGLFSRSIGPTVDQRAISAMIYQKEQELSKLDSQAFLSSSQIANRSASEVDALGRDTLLLPAKMAKFDEIYHLKSLLSNEESRLKAVEDRPTAYFFLVMGLVMFVVGGFLVRVVWRNA